MTGHFLKKYIKKNLFNFTLAKTYDLWPMTYDLSFLCICFFRNEVPCNYLFKFQINELQFWQYFIIFRGSTFWIWMNKMKSSLFKSLLILLIWDHLWIRKRLFIEFYINQSSSHEGKPRVCLECLFWLANKWRCMEQKLSHHNLKPDNRFDSTFEQICDLWIDMWTSLPVIALSMLTIKSCY